MLYKVIDGQDIFELNSELLAIPEFKNLTPRQMTFVCLVADRKTPLRTLPERERREKAARIAGWPTEGTRLDRNGRDVVAGKVPSIEAAIAKYNEYQYDEDQVTLDTINHQIHEIRDYLKSDKNEAKDKGKALEQAAKLGKQLPELVEAKQRLEELLQITSDYKPQVTTYTSLDVPEEYLEGNQKVPTIEIWIEQQKKLNDQA